MGTSTGTVVFEAIVNTIEVEPTTKRVWIEGSIRVQGYPNPVEVIEKQDVTDLLNAQQKAAANTLALGAQAWMDAKLPQETP